MSLETSTRKARVLFARYLLHNDLTAADQTAFRGFVRTTLAWELVGLSALLGLSVLVLWPLDAVFFSGRPEMIETFSSWRPITALFAFTATLVTALPTPLRRRPFSVVVMVGGPPCLPAG